jgi:arylformamidase
MQRDLKTRKQISRRTMLGAAAAMTATPALAQEQGCHIGPPPHDKGPPVWMNLDQVELDAAYDQAFYAPLGSQISARRASNSVAVRARLGEPRRLAYGPTSVEQLDVYRTSRPNAPIFVYIHGGAWLGGQAKNSGDAAELFLSAGAHYVTLDFIAIREAGGDLRVMADQVKRAIAFVYRNAGSFNGDANRLYIGGFSSGGHLCSVALVTDWQKEFGLPADMIKGGLCMSGMYDMKPVRLSKRANYINFTDEMERTMTSQRHLHLLHAPVIATYGGNETPEFQRQNRDFVAAVRAAGKPAELVEALNYNHFEMGESIANPYGPNGRAALALMKLKPA